MAPCPCPTCGQPMNAPRVPLEALRLVEFGKRKRRLVAALADAYPRAVNGAALLDAVYGDDPNGGPEAADMALRVLVSQLRKKLVPMGWTIPHQPAGPAGLQERRLVALEA